MSLNVSTLLTIPLMLLALAPLTVGAAGPCADGTSGHIATQAEVNSGLPAGKPVCPADTAAGFTNDAGKAKAYLNSLPNKCVGACQAPPDKAHIDKLSNTFAICAAGFFKAYIQRYGQVSISSAYRDGPSGENARAGGVNGSNHTIGVAIDVNPAGGGSSYQTMWGFAKANPQFGVCFPHEGADRPHVVLGGIGGKEGGSCAAKGVTKPCNGLSFTPNPASETPTSQLSNAIRQALGQQQSPPPPPPPPMQQPTSPAQQTTPAQSTAQVQTTVSPDMYTVQPTTSLITIKPINVSDLINANAATNTNKNTNNNNASSTASPFDLIQMFGEEPALVSDSIDIGKAVMVDLNPDTSDLATLSGKRPAVTTTTGAVVNYQPVSVPQTFTSGDLANSPVSPTVTGQNTFVLRMLDAMKNTLLFALNYLRPFGGVTQTE